MPGTPIGIPRSWQPSYRRPREKDGAPPTEKVSGTSHGVRYLLFPGMGVPSKSLEDDLAHGLAQHLRCDKKLFGVLHKHQMYSLAVSLPRSHR